MSHSAERKEKNCLNCGTEVAGPFCQACGQQNVEPKETFWGMIVHFFNDITHFDGKFFRTVGLLFRKPGYLSSEYIAGRRNTYLHPVRMYIFTSALFFLVFFSLYHFETDSRPAGVLTTIQQEEFTRQAYAGAKTAADSTKITQALELISAGLDTASARKIAEGREDELEDASSIGIGRGRANMFTMGLDRSIHNAEEYDSVQAALPAGRRDGWLKRRLDRRRYELVDKNGGDEHKISMQVINSFMHKFPYMLFLSLPIYASFLYLLYIRRRKNYYFADHAIFLVHLYIFTFVLLLILLMLLRMPSYWYLNLLKLTAIFYGLYYTLKAFRNFYRQGWLKTLFKFMVFNVLCTISIVFIFLLFGVVAFYFG